MKNNILDKIKDYKISEVEEKKLNFKEIDDKCEECGKKDESVRENLILSGFKICHSCRVSKTVFPV